MKLKKKIKVGIDSPSAAGAGTISKMLAKNYNLLYCDTGKIYRYMAKQIIDRKPTNKIKFLKKISKKINLNQLKSKKLLNDDVAYVASQIAKDPKVRKLVLKFQKKLAYNPPKKYIKRLISLNKTWKMHTFIIFIIIDIKNQRVIGIVVWIILFSKSLIKPSF